MLHAHRRRGIQHQIYRSLRLRPALASEQPPMTRKQRPVHPPQIIACLIRTMTVELHPRSPHHARMLPMPNSIRQAPTDQLQVVDGEEDLGIIQVHGTTSEARAKPPGLRQPAAAFPSQPAGVNDPTPRQVNPRPHQHSPEALKNASRTARQQAGLRKRQQSAAVQSGVATLSNERARFMPRQVSHFPTVVGSKGPRPPSPHERGSSAPDDAAAPQARAHGCQRSPHARAH